MSSDWTRKQRRQQEVKDRAAQPNHMYGYCRIIGCNKPARAGTSDGLDEKYCRSHAEHVQRHGSPVKKSYTGKELTPYRRAALDWILSHEEDVWVQNAIQRVRTLYQQAGDHIEAFRLRGLTPMQRSMAALARLRKVGIDPRLVISACIAVEMLVLDDQHPANEPEFKRVQIAKVVHRMASGSHRRWEREVASSAWPGQRQVITEEMHVYPRSRGRVLRHLGQALESATELLVAHHLDDFRAYKQECGLQDSASMRPYPRRWAAKSRRGRQP